VLAHSSVVIPAESFTVEQQPAKSSAYRHKMQDEIAELAAQYTELIAKELCLLTDALTKKEALPGDLLQQRYAQLLVAQHFLVSGDYDESLSVQQDGVGLPEVCAAAAQVQCKLLGVVRALLEQNVQSCFVAARARVTLQRYQERFRALCQESIAAGAWWGQGGREVKSTEKVSEKE